jgi:hypothetical protein
MHIQQFKCEDDVTYRAVETPEGIEHVADLGADVTDATVDVVEGTAIVVLADDQYEIDLPGGDAEAFIRNGVLSISMEDDA